MSATRMRCRQEAHARRSLPLCGILSSSFSVFSARGGSDAPTTTTAQGVPTTPAPEPAYTAAYVPDAPRRPKICMLEEDEGECDSKEQGPGSMRVFFNAKTNTCDHFPYSGCKGNANNFADEDECMERCRIGAAYDIKEDARLPKVCKLRMAPGHCESGQDPVLRYFYNQYTERCEVFTYSGCGGNENNFKTEHDCETRCISASRATWLQLPSPTSLLLNLPDAPVELQEAKSSQ
ncbi:hypothetical protein HPB47_015708 [Ixodes persulcatus]|uniref:Uncharacterized protein n=1 Tax=Ixodes persulcatus TaxID=34615 RepID=A0AC60QSR9_IXOPE|nr:hypothetical protein HPB47_015708 [Ixodes persulcatus]